MCQTLERLACLEAVGRETRAFWNAWSARFTKRLVITCRLSDLNSLAGEIFLARNVPVDKLAVTEGRLEIVAIDKLEHIRELLAPPATYALGIFLSREQAI
jgi:hypothetical protein